VAAGTLQWSAWKARRLADYRQPPVAIAATAGTALRHGLRLGLDCCASCAGLMAILFVLGVMDLVAMTLVAAAITVERLAPARLRAPRAVGVVAVAGGLVLLLRTV
jgi:predicted metal-binding membrane protein